MNSGALEFYATVRRSAKRLRRARSYSAAVIASLALGIGLNTAVYSLLRHGLLRPLPYGNPDAIVAIGTRFNDGSDWESSSRDLDVWSASSRTLTEMTWVATLDGHVIAGDSSKRFTGVRTPANFLNVLRTRPRVGRWFTAEEVTRDEPVVLLSEALWHKYFGSDTRRVGSATLRIEERLYTVIGVIASESAFPAKADFWYPSATPQFVQVIGRARQGVSTSDVERELNTLSVSVPTAREVGRYQRIVVSTLHERLYGANGPILRLLFETVALLMLLTCANVASLSLARMLDRHQEFVICTALGAGRLHLISEMLVENALLALSAGIAGILAAVWMTNFLVSVSPRELPGVRGAGVDSESVLFALVGVMIALAVTSVAPVISVIRNDIGRPIGQSAVRGGSRSANKMRNALVSAQLAVALILLVSSGLLLRSMIRLVGIDAGFNRRNLVVAQLALPERYGNTAARRALIGRFREGFETIPGVRGVALGPPPLVGKSGHSLTDGFNNVIGVRDSLNSRSPAREVWVKYVDAGYLETFGIRLRGGRGIAATDVEGAAPVALMNLAAERIFFADGHALGGTFSHKSMSGGHPITVVGLLPDVRQRDITIPALPEILLSDAQQIDPDNVIYLSVRTNGSDAATVQAMRRIVTTIDADVTPRRISSMDAIVAQTLAPQRFVLFSLGAIALVGLGLAAFGQYSVVMYTTAARTGEIGVRIALGARAAQVQWMVLRDGMRLAALGALVGLPLCYVSSRFMARYLYDVDAHDPVAMLLPPLLLVLAGMAATYLPARRAARVDPMVALRGD